ncbi:MAG: sulfatase, partial [Candidatus Hydrogenedentes bacterium]|nr:sulfatase [Candidatus Hydrogenedentota bacterium]
MTDQSGRRVLSSRRVFLRNVAASLTALSLSVHAGERRKRPNVLFIAIDDLNDWVGCLGGHPDARTPNIDRLAARGVNFTRAYCSAPACNPSRTSLLTGKLPSTSGVYHNNQPWRPAMPDAVTLPQHFMANGYRVMGCGKIFHGRFPEPESWHEYFDNAGSPLPPNRPLNGIPRTAHFDWGPMDCNDEDMNDWKLIDWAQTRLEREWDKPFFLAVGLVKPHLPWYVPRKYFDLFPPDKITLPDVNANDLDDVPEAGRKMARTQSDHRRVLETENWRKAVSGYLATGAFTDACVGRLIDILDNSPYADNTIIVLWSDHGWHLGEKLHWRKFALWEEATHNPLMFVVPGMTKPNSV